MCPIFQLPPIRPFRSFGETVFKPLSESYEFNCEAHFKRSAIAFLMQVISLATALFQIKEIFKNGTFSLSSLSMQDIKYKTSDEKLVKFRIVDKKEEEDVYIKII